VPREVIDRPDPIEFLSILDAGGGLDRALEPAINGDDLRRLYATMLLARRLDERILILHRQGRIATALSNRGQEAVALGAAFALSPSDWMIPYFRELAAYLWRGWKPAQLILYLAGYAEGMAIPPDARDLPLCIPVASQLPHAVGLAYASQHRGEDSVALAFLGDGATSHGDFHEAMNFAGVFQAPVVFCCANNQWAISVPVTRQTRARTLARKAQAYGMAGIQVDGNDLLAVYAATREAVERARAGGGPTFIECLTYRIGAHSTADDPRRYRQETEAREWEARDPLARFRAYVEARGLLDASAHDALDLRLGQEIHAAVAEAEARMEVRPLAIFDHLGPLSAELQEQRGELVRELADTSSART
jgi:pyruvate dehydrogenase E1 component alpha subunit